MKLTRRGENVAMLLAVLIFVILAGLAGGLELGVFDD